MELSRLKVDKLGEKVGGRGGGLKRQWHRNGEERYSRDCVTSQVEKLVAVGEG